MFFWISWLFGLLNFFIERFDLGKFLSDVKCLVFYPKVAGISLEVVFVMKAFTRKKESIFH